LASRLFFSGEASKPDLHLGRDPLHCVALFSSLEYQQPLTCLSVLPPACPPWWLGGAAAEGQGCPLLANWQGASAEWRGGCALSLIHYWYLLCPIACIHLCSLCSMFACLSVFTLYLPICVHPLPDCLHSHFAWPSAFTRCLMSAFTLWVDARSHRWAQSMLLIFQHIAHVHPLPNLWPVSCCCYKS